VSSEESWHIFVVQTIVTVACLLRCDYYTNEQMLHRDGELA